MTATVAGIHLGLDTHANRPAANTVPDGSLYSCSPHALVYKSNLTGNTWATWATLGGGALTDPMTNRGDMIYRDAANATARLPLGAAGTVLRSDGTDASWGFTGFHGCKVFHSTTQSIGAAADTAMLFDSEVYDTSALHFTSAANLTGTVAKATGSPTITGSGTSFTTELAVNQVVTVPGTATEFFVVKTLTDDTHFDAWANAANTATGQTATRHNDAFAIPAGLGGYWRISASTEVAATSNEKSLAFSKNGAAGVSPLYGGGGSGGTLAGKISGSTVELLSAGDFVMAVVRIAGGTNNIGSASVVGNQSAFWMELIGV